MRNKSSVIIISLLLLSVGAFVGCATRKVEEDHKTTDIIGGPVFELEILATSDMHDHMLNYDYYTTTSTDDYGLVKIATLINSIRNNREGASNNVVLVDNGDLIQGNPFGDYYAKINPVQKGETHPVYRALEILEYDAAGLGNHEFNYGIDFLQQIINDTSVPIINANVYNKATGQNEFKPYVIVPKTFDDGTGNIQEINVGIISFVPTQILNWDKLELEGKVNVEDIRKCAEKFIPIMHKEGADVIVALAHTGYGSDGEYVEGAENMAYHLTLIDDIDVVVGGHSHESFPSEQFVKDTGYQNVDLEKGTINGTFTVQPTKYAQGLGVVSLHLVKTNDGSYQIVDGQSQILSSQGIVNDESFENAMLPYHEKVINYVNEPVGEVTAPLNSFFSLLGDDASVQLVSDAQLAYAKVAREDAEELAPYRDLPVLSAAAPFKAGLSKGEINPDDYLNIAPGGIAIKDVASLYKYPNTAVILKLRGADIREWLEMSAGIYSLIVPGRAEPQPLFVNDFPAYNFDTIDGVEYEVDVTQLPRYNADGGLINANSHRIINLKYNGADLKDEDEFLVITNNYRGGGGGNFPIFGGNNNPIVYSSSDETRQIIADYITSQGKFTPSADGNWRLAPIGEGARGLFVSSAASVPYAESYPNLTEATNLGNGLAQYIYVFSEQ